SSLSSDLSNALPSSDTAPMLMEHIPVGETSVGALLLARGVSEPYGPSQRHMARLFAGQLGEIMQNAAALRATERTYRDTLTMLVGLMDSRQPETQGHSSRVRRWSVLIGRAMGLDTDQLETLEWSALLHDVGMSGIPDEVLKTKGGITTDEYQLIRQHPDLGAVMAEPLHLPLSLSPGIRSHHERWDGRGYPDRLAGGQIPVHGRIIAVAEVFNALVSPRSYRAPRSYPDALAIIQGEAGKSFDPRVVAAFEKAIQAESATAVPPRCFELKGMSSDLCGYCPAFKAPEPCWKMRGVLCEIHGDRRCEDCFVYTRVHESSSRPVVAAPSPGLLSLVTETVTPVSAS
ncbi:MAG: HD-GYP domain-containing protein, partial [Chloroflexi bacterium]|nr:HD-GYP domain-containing protein [Chloroflexota bacterium]